MDVFDTYYSSALSESKVAISAGDYETGRRKASAAISAMPTFDAYIERAECFIQLNNILAAKIDLDTCLQIMKKRGRHSKDSAQRLKLEELVQACNRPARKGSTSVTQAMCVREKIDPLSLLQTFELSHLRDTLSSLTQTAVRLSVGQQNPKCPEQSKFGGIPFGLPEARIPSVENSPLPLLMQINLGELQKVFSGFPLNGFLYFFFDPKLCLGRTRFVEDRKSWRVVFYKGNNLECKTDTQPSISLWKEKSIELDFNVSLPALLSPFIQSLAHTSMTQRDLESYKLMLAFYNGDFDHRLFGYPALVMQDSQALNAELLANEIDLSKIDFLSQSVSNKCRLKSTDWRLLAQIDCCPQAEMWWGSNGKLFFWIRQRDLQQLNFDNVMLQWQSLSASGDERLAEEDRLLKSESRFELDSDFELHKSVEDALWETAIFRPYQQQFAP